MSVCMCLYNHLCMYVRMHTGMQVGGYECLRDGRCMYNMFFTYLHARGIASACTHLQMIHIQYECIQLQICIDIVLIYIQSDICIYNNLLHNIYLFMLYMYILIKYNQI